MYTSVFVYYPHNVCIYALVNKIYICLRTYKYFEIFWVKISDFCICTIKQDYQVKRVGFFI